MFANSALILESLTFSFLLVIRSKLSFKKAFKLSFSTIKRALPGFLLSVATVAFNLPLLIRRRKVQSGILGKSEISFTEYSSAPGIAYLL